MDIKDSSNNLDYYKVINQLTQAITQLGIDSKKDIANIKSVIDGTAFKSNKTTHVTKGILNHIKDNGSTLHYPSHSISVPNESRLLTIKNPERLNTIDRLIAGEWGIEYMGRDLSLEEDNYRWDVYSEVSKISGYYIIERELIQGDWLNVRWGRVPTNVKERKEVIDKSRLANPSQIRRDMIKVIMNSK